MPNYRATYVALVPVRMHREIIADNVDDALEVGVEHMPTALETEGLLMGLARDRYADRLDWTIEGPALIDDERKPNRKRMPADPRYEDCATCGERYHGEDIGRWMRQQDDGDWACKSH